MKRIVMLVILVITIIGCSYMEEGERSIRERGLECRYNYKRELQHCGYIN